MNQTQHYGLFAKDVAKLMLWANECGYMVELVEGHPLAIRIQLYSFEGKKAETESYKEIGQYWEELDPANKWGGLRYYQCFERKYAQDK